MGWLESDNRAISVQLNLTGTATGTKPGNTFLPQILTELEQIEDKENLKKFVSKILENLNRRRKLKVFRIIWVNTRPCVPKIYTSLLS